MFLLLQRARWDASGRLVATDLTRDTVINLGMGIGTVILETNMTFPLDHAGKGRDLFLLITASRDCECLNVVSQPVPSVPLRHHGPAAGTELRSNTGLKHH